MAFLLGKPKRAALLIDGAYLQVGAPGTDLSQLRGELQTACGYFCDFYQVLEDHHFYHFLSLVHL